MLAVLALAFSAIGGAKLAVWSVSLGRADHWSETVTWKLVLTATGLIEIAIGIALVVVSNPRPVLRWTMRLLALYAVVLVIGEFSIGGFSGSCGCLGPGVALGMAEHVIFTGLLIAATWWCERAASLGIRWDSRRPIEGPGP